MSKASPKRLPPEERSAAILQAAQALLQRSGLQGFSLEAVAREAGVALSLPRHYFGGYRELLKAATEDLLREVERTMLDRRSKTPLLQRFTAYLDILSRNPWAHEIWMRSAETHPEVDALVRNARLRMAEGMYRRPWTQLSLREQYDARGRIGYVEAIVTDWLERGEVDKETVVDLIVRVISEPAAVGSGPVPAIAV